jgi:hypothetical protein
MKWDIGFEFSLSCGGKKRTVSWVPTALKGLYCLYFSIYSKFREGLFILINLKYVFHFNSVNNSLIFLDIIYIYRTVMNMVIQSDYSPNRKVCRAITNTTGYLPSIIENAVVC